MSFRTSEGNPYPPDGRALAEKLIMLALIEHGPMTRQELCKRTGLGHETVHKYLSDLIDVHLVLREREPGRSRAFRYEAPAGAEYWYTPPRLVAA